RADVRFGTPQPLRQPASGVRSLYSGDQKRAQPEAAPLVFGVPPSSLEEDLGRRCDQAPLWNFARCRLLRVAHAIGGVILDHRIPSSARDFPAMRHGGELAFNDIGAVAAN